MKRALWFVAFFFAVAANCFGQDAITGTWKADGVAFAPWTITLKTDGTKVTGTVSQGGSNGTMTTGLTASIAIYDGAVAGDHVTFKCDTPDHARTISFSGVIAGDSITFDRQVSVQPGAATGQNGIYGAGGAAHFTAKRSVGPTIKPLAPTTKPVAPAPANSAVLMPAQITELPVPKISDLARVDRNTPPSGQDAVTAAFILKTSPHLTLGDAYVIVTDQSDAAFVAPLDRLARFHGGSVIHVKDLGSLRTAEAQRNQLISDLRLAKPRYVAVAPRLENFTPEMLVGVWSVLAALGDDQRLAVFPGILAAPTAKALDALVHRSINPRPLTAAQVRTFVMGQVLGPNPFGLRSLQKVRLMRNVFADYGCSTDSLVTLAYSAVQSGVSIAPAIDQWQAAMSGPGDAIKSIPAAAAAALDNDSILLMFGHGNPGTACSLDVSAFRDVNMNGKIVMCGDCFSAASGGSSLTPAGNGPAARNGQPEDESFAMRAVENGAVVVYAHMRENAGFPHLYPVLEGWMNGLTVGEAYQRQINALIEVNGFTAAQLASGDVANNNSLLYVIIGDPALQPLAKMTPAKRSPGAP